MTTTRTTTARLLALTAIAAAMYAEVTQAGVFTWTNNIKNNWTSANWSGSSAGYPTAMDDSAKYVSNSFVATTTLNIATATVGVISNSGNKVWTIAADSNNYSLTLNGTGGAQILNNNVGGLVINPNVIMGSNLAVTSSAAGTLTLAGAIDMAGHDLTVLADKSGATLGGAITGAGNVSLITNNQTTAASTITVTSLNHQGTLTVDGTKGSSGASTVTIATLGANVTNVTKNGVNALVLSGNNGYTGAITVNGGSLTISGSNTYTGATTVSGATLTINSASGAINNSPRISLNTSTLNLDYTAANIDRLKDTGTVTLSRSTLTLTANASANTTETIGTFGIGEGPSIVTITSASDRLTTLAAGVFSRANNGTTLIRGSNLTMATSASASRVTFTDGGASLGLVGTNVLNNGAGNDTTQGLKIVPYLTGDTSLSGVGASFLTYDTTLGLRQLIAGESTSLTSGYTTAAAPDNARVASTLTLTNAAGITVNSLQFSGGTNATLNSTNANPLTVNSGAIASFSSNVNMSHTIGSGFSSLILGNGEGIVTVAYSSGTITIAAPINVTNGGGLTKTGSGTLALTAANLYTGTTTINQGTLQIGKGGTTGAVSSNVTNFATLSFNRSDDVLFSNTISGIGQVTQIGTGTLTLSANNRYSGATTVSSGGLKAGNAGAFGTGTVTVSGGILDLTAYDIANVINITGTAASVRLRASTGALTSNFAAGSSFRGWQRAGTGAIGLSTASLLSGTAVGASAVISSWTNDRHGNSQVVTDVLDLAGTGAANLYVLQMTYADSTLNDANARLMYWMSGSNQWVNAIYGNGYTGPEGSPILGGYDNNLTLGNWGRDTNANTVWAVVDHNSEFAVAVPEPAALALLGLGSAVLLLRRRKNG